MRKYSSNKNILLFICPLPSWVDSAIHFLFYKSVGWKYQCEQTGEADQAE